MRSSVSDSLGGCMANCVLHQRFARQHFHAHALDARRGAGEIALDERLAPADGLENLRALITLQRGNAHLRKGLQQAFVDGLHVVLENLVPGVVRREMRRRGADPRAFRSRDKDSRRSRRSPAAARSASPRAARPIRRSAPPDCASSRESNGCARPKAPAGWESARTRRPRRGRKESAACSRT